MILLGIIGGYFLIIKRSKKYNISSEHIDNLAIITVPLAIVGARLYHVVSEWNYYKDNLNQIISYQMNGLGIFGAIIVGIIVFYLYSKKHSIPILRLLDLGSLGLLLGQTLGRFGNYFNNELYGYPTKLPWKVFIPYENRMEGYLKYEYYHPTFFYESIWNLVGLLIALYYERKKEKINSGTIFSFYLMWYGIGRFLIGFLRIEPVDFLIFNDGQILSIIFVVLGFGLLMNSRKNIKNEA